MYTTPALTIEALTLNMNPQLGSRFCCLPPEMCNEIYAFVAASVHDTEIEASIATPPMNIMLLSCKKIFDEAVRLARTASPMYWENNTFLFTRYPGISKPITIGYTDGHILRQIKHIKIATDTRRLTLTRADEGTVSWIVVLDGDVRFQNGWLYRVESDRSISRDLMTRETTEELVKRLTPLCEPSVEEVDNLAFALQSQRWAYDLAVILNFCCKGGRAATNSLFSM